MPPPYEKAGFGPGLGSWRSSGAVTTRSMPPVSLSEDWFLRLGWLRFWPGRLRVGEELACRLFGRLVVGCLAGVDPEELACLGDWALSNETTKYVDT